MEHNQCRSLFHFSVLGSAESMLFFGRRESTVHALICFVALPRFSTPIVNKPVNDSLVMPPSLTFTGLHHGWAGSGRLKCSGMGVIIELQNLGDGELCREITAQLEHAFSDRKGDWRVSIAGSRASDTWEMRVEGPNSFERSYNLTVSAGEHSPDAIRRLLVQLLPRC